MSDPIVSVLLPSRGRPKLLQRSITSLFMTAVSPNDFEVLVGVDHDDHATREAARELPCELHVFRQRYGYARLHEYVNVLSAEARGKWLLLWNDDALMGTDRWPDIADSYPDPSVLHVRTNHNPDPCVFPIVSASIVKALGHWSLSPHNDTWMYDVGARAGVYRMTDIYAEHDRFDLTGNNDDETYRESQAGYRTDDYLGREMQAAIDRDASIVRSML